MRNIAAVKPCSMFRLTIPLVAGIFVACACFWHGNIGVLDWFDCIGEMARLPFPMVIWRHVFYVSILHRGIVGTAKIATGGL